MRQTLLILSLSVVAGASAQVSFNGGTYSQDFNSLATSGTVAWNDNSTLQGWYLRRMDDANGELGDEYRGGDGTSNAGAAYGFGTGTDSERALGSVASGSVEHLAYGVRLTNDTGADITEFTLSYMGEQWRNGGNATPQTLLFSYNIGGASIGNDQQVSGGEAGYVADSSFTQVSSLDFLSPIANATASALDGNAAANRSLISGTVSTSIGERAKIFGFAGSTSTMPVTTTVWRLMT